jgi:hypothetical protein
MKPELYIDFFDEDRRALPLPEIHLDTGPMTELEAYDWLLMSRGLLKRHPGYSTHPGLRQVVSATLAFLDTPQGQRILND